MNGTLELRGLDAAARSAMKGHAGNLGPSAALGARIDGDIVECRLATALRPGLGTRGRQHDFERREFMEQGLPMPPRRYEGCVNHLRPHGGVSVSLVLRRHQPTPHAAGMLAPALSVQYREPAASMFNISNILDNAELNSV